MIRGIKRLFGGGVNQSSPVFLFSISVLFWTVFDSVMSYVTPLLMEERGFSTSMIGFIIGASSVAGAAFDFLICKIFKNTDFRRVMLFMFAICAIYPFILWQAKDIWMFLLAMAVWGVYYDLLGFGTFNFVGKYIKRAGHSSSFGVIQIFRALGSVLALMVVGLIVVDVVDWRSFAFGWVVLGVGFIFFVALLALVRRNHIGGAIEPSARRKNLLVEVHLWEKLGRLLLPVLSVTFYLLFIDAFFWTLAPLYAEGADLAQFGGLFLAAYVIPELIVGWFVGPVTGRFGKKRTAYVSLLIGSLILSLFFMVSTPALAIVLVFVSSLFINFAYPVISSSYADYISDAPLVDGEIEGLEDFFTNFGYILGPFFAGVMADAFNIPIAFSILGVLGVIFATALLVTSPKHIIIKTKRSEL